MNFIDIQNFFADYSLSSVIIACIVCAITFFTDKLLRNKTVKLLGTLIPFILGIIFVYLKSLIFDHVFALSLSTVSAGFMSGWLSIVIKVIIKRATAGQKEVIDQDLAVIIGIIEGYVKNDCIDGVATFIKELIATCCENEPDNVIKNIADTLTQNAVDEQFDFTAIAGLIFASVKQMAS